MWKALCLELWLHGVFKQAYAVFQKKRHRFRSCHFLEKNIQGKSGKNSTFTKDYETRNQEHECQSCLPETLEIHFDISLVFV